MHIGIIKLLLKNKISFIVDQGCFSILTIVIIKLMEQLYGNPYFLYIAKILKYYRVQKNKSFLARVFSVFSLVFFFVISKYKAPFLLININIKKKKKLLVLSTHVPASGCHPRCLKRHVRHISATKNDQLPCQQKHSVTNQLIRWLLFLFPLFPDLEFHVRPSKIQLCP